MMGIYSYSDYSLDLGLQSVFLLWPLLLDLALTGVAESSPELLICYYMLFSPLDLLLNYLLFLLSKTVTA